MNFEELCQTNKMGMVSPKQDCQSNKHFHGIYCSCTHYRYFGSFLRLEFK